MFKKKCNKYPLNIIQEINLILNRSTGKTEQCQGKGSQHEQSQVSNFSVAGSIKSSFAPDASYLNTKKKSEDRWEETGSERERERANQNINNPEKSETLEVMVERKVLTLKKKKGTLKIFNFFDNLFKITLNVFFLTITWL